MSDRVFLDTNILIYAHDRGAGERHEKARDLIDRLWWNRRGVLSTQVLQEFAVNVRRKAKNPIPAEEVEAVIRDYLTWEVVVNGGEAILGALKVEERYGISFWDALLVSAANLAGVDQLFTEDLNHGQKYDTVQVINPFVE